MSEDKQELTVNERERLLMEQISLYADPKYSRRAAQITTISSLYSPMSTKPRPLYLSVKTMRGEVIEEETKDSILAGQAWDELVARLGRNPNKWELINETRSLAAIYDTSSAGFIRDTAGFKPIDETKNELLLKASPLRDYTEEELESIIAEETARREQKEKKHEAVDEKDSIVINIE